MKKQFILFALALLPVFGIVNNAQAQLENGRYRVKVSALNATNFEVSMMSNFLDSLAIIKIAEGNDTANIKFISTTFGGVNVKGSDVTGIKTLTNINGEDSTYTEGVNFLNDTVNGINGYTVVIPNVYDSTFSVVTTKLAQTPKANVLLAFDMVNAIPVKENDTTLSSITLSSGILAPVFASEVFAYTVTVPYYVYKFTATGIPTELEAGATVENTVKVDSLLIGENIFKLVVTAPDGTSTGTYTITVNRPEPQMNDTTLQDIILSAGNLTPALNTVLFTYVVNVPYDTTKISIEGIASGAEFGAVVAGNVTDSALVVGNNVFTLVVTSAEGEETGTYTITVVRAPQSGIDKAAERTVKLSIFPNPANSVANVKVTGATGDIQMEIYNIAGVKVSGEKIQAGVTHSLSNLNKGIYFVRILTNQGIITEKLIVR